VFEPYKWHEANAVVAPYILGPDNASVIIIAYVLLPKIYKKAL